MPDVKVETIDQSVQDPAPEIASIDTSLDTKHEVNQAVQSVGLSSGDLEPQRKV